jgi:excisionase family DNA binding protein
MDKKILNLDELATYTGISKSYLYKLTSQGIIPHSKPFGKMIFFDKEEIDKFLLSNKIKLASEIETEAATFVTLRNKG